MTEKRFKIYVDSNNLKSLWDDERIEAEPLLWLTLSDRIGGIDNVCELLNEFHEENIELKKENEQLKQFQDRVFSWIDMHLQRLPTLRDDEFESDNEFADPSLYSGAIQILETMKRELKGDVE